MTSSAAQQYGAESTVRGVGDRVPTLAPASEPQADKFLAHVYPSLSVMFVVLQLQ